MVVNVVNAFSQFYNFSAVRVCGNCHVARRIKVNTNPADFIEHGKMNFNHLSAGKSCCDTIRKLLLKLSFFKTHLLLMIIIAG